MAAHVQVKQVTVDEVVATLDAAWQRIEAVVLRLGPVLDSGPDEGGWTPRQVLTHLIGSWELDAVRMGYYLDEEGRKNVPLVFHQVYWKPEYEHAPLKSFHLALKQAYLGERALIQQLSQADLTQVGMGRGGESTLADYLLFSPTGHRADFHIPQLEAFLTRDGAI